MEINFFKITVIALLLPGIPVLADATGAADDVPKIYVVEADAPNQAVLTALLNSDFTIDNLSGNTLTLYLDADEYNQVMHMGCSVRVIEIQSRVDALTKATGYTTPDDIASLFAQYAETYPELCRVYTLGQSVQGRELWAIKITPAPDVPADKPAVKYIATIHGDEPIGTELCMFFAEELLSEYGVDPYITDFLDRTIIWLVPMMNPDGFVSYMRYNANYVDLNRVFPAYPDDFTGTWFDGEPLGDAGRQPEVAHIMRWSATNHFSLSANFHSGALVVNYPYDNEPGIPSGTEAPSPDDSLFQYISLQYAMHNPPMYNSEVFEQGIVNGSDWYSITGGMMDWNYRFMGCPEVTIELSDTKRPLPSSIPQFWADNRDAMYAYAETAHIGIRGVIRDRNTEAPVWAKILLAGNTQPVFSNADFGNYHRLALSGAYDLSFHAEDYISYHVDNVMVNGGTATRVDISMSDGDINGDGARNGADVQMAVDAVLGRPVSYNADVDGRGLSATDIQAVINKTAM